MLIFLERVALPPEPPPWFWVLRTRDHNPQGRGFASGGLAGGYLLIESRVCTVMIACAADESHLLQNQPGTSTRVSLTNRSRPGFACSVEFSYEGRFLEVQVPCLGFLVSGLVVIFIMKWSLGH